MGSWYNVNIGPSMIIVIANGGQVRSCVSVATVTLDYNNAFCLS